MAPAWLVALSAAVNYYFVQDKIENDVVAVTAIAAVGGRYPAVVCDARAEMCNAILRPLQDAGVSMTQWNLEGFNRTLNLMRREILLKYDMILILQEHFDFVPLLKDLKLVNSQARFVIAWVGTTTDIEPDCCKHDYKEAFSELWYFRRIYRAVLLPLSCPGFVFATDLPRNDRGRCMRRISVDDSRRLLKVFNRRVTNMYGHILRISMSHVPDLHLINSTDGIPYDGVDATILREFVRYLNFTAEVKPGRAKYGYTYSNGTMIGTALDLTFGATDMAFNGNFIYYLGSTPAELSTWYKEDALCVVVKKAGQVPKLLALFSPFSQGFLWAVFFMVGIVGCVLYGIRLVGHLLGEPQTSLFDSLAIPAGFMFESPMTHKKRTNSERALLASCSLWAIVVFGTYQGTLRGTLTTPKDLPDIKTLEELSEKGFKIYVGSEQLLNVFSYSGNNLIKHLRDRTYLNKDKNPFTNWSRSGVITRSGTSYRTVQEDQHMVPDCVRLSYLSFFVRVGSPATPALNEMLSRFVEAGIITRYFQSERRAQQNRNKKFPSSSTSHPGKFTLADVQGAFVILAIGLIFNTVIFVLELLDGRTKKIKNGETGRVASHAFIGLTTKISVHAKLKIKQ